MSVVAVCTAGGSTGSTTTALLLAAMAPADRAAMLVECDPDGGDVAAWAELSASRGWSSAVSATDRSWSGLVGHTQELPGLTVVVSPTRPSQARSAVREAASGFAGLLAGMPDVLAVADCGLVTLEVPAWASPAQLALLLVRQVPGSAPATVARVDRGMEAVEVLRGGCRQVGVVLIGGAPYSARDVSAALGFELFGVLPEDAPGAGLVCGGWTLGRRATRSPLARGAASLARRVVEVVYGRQDLRSRPASEVAR